ncbi:MAG TPA: tetratricopeptide repeat protein, partial [Syntrophales bacterium]|nr:tetratricopeptide repeat protein [Syntrophales bacterium]
LVTLPFVLLLLDYWPLRRFKLGSSDKVAPSAELTSGKQSSKKKKTKRQTVEVAPHYSSLPHLVKEKIPFFILSALSSLITVLAAQGAGAASGLEALPLGTRIYNAVVSYVIYMWKMIWPQNLAVFYPHPGMLPVWEVLGALLVLALITYLVVRAANKFPYLPVGWLWYLGTMVPVIGIVQAGAQAMADRYTYIPLIGVFVMIVWGLPELAKTWRHQRIMLGILAGFIITMMVIGSWLQVRYWHESVTLFQHALDVTPQNATAHNNLGTAFREKGDMDKAIFHYMEAARIDPKDPKPYYNIGEVLAQRGEIKGAIPYFQKALDIKPDFLKARYNLGLAFMQMGDLEQASQHFRETIRIMPADKEANLNMGVIQARRGNYDEAISYFYRVLQTRPDYAEAHKNLGIALMQKGYLYEAISRLQEALRILPSDPEIPYILGRVFAKQGNLDKAAMYLTKSLEIKPDNADAHNSLGATLARQGKLHEAISHFQEALRIRPGYREALNNLQVALAQQKNAR